MEDDNREQEWTDPRPKEGWDPMAGGGDDADEVDTAKNAEEAREGEDDAS